MFKFLNILTFYLLNNSLNLAKRFKADLMVNSLTILLTPTAAYAHSIQRGEPEIVSQVSACFGL